ncbi:VolA/Pla-1 family phospholipase [Grimontia sp. NTOU-MAR1]|uniref:VolA/Pla-1 family phospholipase n=1 Tax=Grimontia sp. NTOU-MAR1 TaxID=3111011 RepID=UPI002DB834C1|nr:VolA/Pla-1 family phospholipase [Grimontia sp. NTOU-MAR1]WRV98961.1 VolA/Pla-1 family phospholipase [Grimontia sp. NTOU-MAR1]
MKKRILALLVSTALLSACNDSSLSGDATVDPDLSNSLNAATKIQFDLISDPDNPQVVTPSFIAMDANDGTLATDGTLGSAGYSTNIGDPEVTLGKTDGWGTSVPMTFTFTGEDLDSSTANLGFKLIESGDPTSSEFAQSTPVELVAGKDFVASTSGKTLIVYLEDKPLKPATNYMLAITNELKDVNGESVGTTSSYAVLKDKATPPSDALVPAQTITRAVESEFSKVGVSSSDIIFSTWFTTASAGDVLYGAKLATAQVYNARNIGGNASLVWQGSAANVSLTEAEINSVFSISAGSGASQTTTEGHSVISLSVKLPYYLSSDPSAFATTPWQSGMPSLAVISSTLSSGADEDKAAILGQLASIGISESDLSLVATDSEKQAEVVEKLVGKTLTTADGSQLDSERLVTRYSPIPKLQSIEDVALTMVVSKECVAPNDYGTAQTVIFQHGITTSKDVLTDNNGELADAIIDDSCMAILAIDHPIHGERALANGAITATVNESDPNDAGNASYYLNLAALPVARDNLRQSVIDIVNLRAAIGGEVFGILAAGGQRNDITELNFLAPTKGVAFIGHSLGAITGVDVGNIANRSVGNTQADALLFNVRALALANPGAGIPYLLLNSNEFGNFVKGSLVAGSDASFAETCANAFGGDVAACFAATQSALIGAGDSESTQSLAAMYNSFNSYAYAAQTILDTVDPINHGGLISENVPVYLASVANDQVIPNQLQRTPVTGAILEPYSPFGGTLPLIPVMDLSATTSPQSGSVVKSALLFTEGDHSSLNGTPASTTATEVMRNSISSFVLGDGTSLTISNSSVLSESQ